MDYTLIRSKRKTISIEVSRGLEITVRAPLRMPMRDIEKFVASRQAWLQNALTRQAARSEAMPEPTEDERRSLIAAAKRLLPERVAHYAEIMGLYPAHISITGAKTRFGSCSGKNRICFSWRLMRYPAQAIDYVVVHELAHIKHHNHSRDFYTLVESILPDYKERQKLLR